MVLPLPAVDSVTTQLADPNLFALGPTQLATYVATYLCLLAQTYSVFTFYEDLQIYNSSVKCLWTYIPDHRELMIGRAFHHRTQV